MSQRHYCKWCRREITGSIFTTADENINFDDGM